MKQRLYRNETEALFRRNRGSTGTKQRLAKKLPKLLPGKALPQSSGNAPHVIHKHYFGNPICKIPSPKSKNTKTIH